MTKSQWRTYSPFSPTSGLNMASAGSSRIYFEHAETGEVCYRDAGWMIGGQFDVYSNARGHGVDPETLKPNGKVYPASEF